MLKKYLLYLLRWQLSTPILAVCVIFFASLGSTWATIIANLIGGMIFFFIDKWIFSRSNLLGELWEKQDNIHCADCGKLCVGYRLVKKGKYNKLDDREPEYR